MRAHLATEDLHAPSLLDVEVVSALRGLTRVGDLSPPGLSQTVEAVSAPRGLTRVGDLSPPGLSQTVEVVSALRGLTRAGHLSGTRAQDALTDFDDLPVQRWPAADALRRRAFQLRDNLSSYDAAYVALAEALECPLLTRDARLARPSGHVAQIDVR